MGGGGNGGTDTGQGTMYLHEYVTHGNLPSWTLKLETLNRRSSARFCFGMEDGSKSLEGPGLRG